ncbi:MAG TPA: HlyD family type I secretion periplasmic adaptor subunit [Rhizomicrobium sp.]|jgi:HlyD family type I secretion membrane fusion protein|nr:HlyD family type I secretion periplasmic adaptor subunit [Rhizomicrobium sp.]
MSGPVTWDGIKHGAHAAALWTRELLSPVEESRDPALAFMATRGIVGTGRLVILVFIVGFFGWAALAPLDSAVMAPGFIVVETHRKTIQHLEGGIVRDVLVVDGQTVSAGQLLVRMDDTQARASLQLLDGEGDALAAQEARLIAERDGAASVTFPPELVARADDPKVAAAMHGELSAFDTRRETLAKQIDILSKRSAENASIIAGLRNEQTAVERQMTLIDQETASVQTLYDQKLSTLSRLLALQRQAADLAGQRGQLVEKIAQTELTSGENQLQIMNLKNQQLSDVVKDLRDVQTKRFDILDRSQAARDILARLTIRAPVSGKVVSLAVHTNGAVVKPGDTIMEIVPQKDALEVEAHVRPEDADSIHVGMSARVNLSAYQSRRLPIIEGVVSTISADRLLDPRTGQPYFNVNLTVDRTPLKDYPNARLIPGLPVEVAMDTGSRTALDYFVEPITDVFRKGMKEK